jgi:hypothetical protein
MDASSDAFNVAVALVAAVVGLVTALFSLAVRRRGREHDAQERLEFQLQAVRALEDAIEAAVGEGGGGEAAEPDTDDARARTEREDRLRVSASASTTRSEPAVSPAVADAVQSVRLDQLTRDLERVEKNQLSRWDVALVVFGVIAGIVGVITLADWVKREAPDPAPAPTVTAPASAPTVTAPAPAPTVTVTAPAPTATP